MSESDDIICPSDSLWEMKWNKGYLAVCLLLGNLIMAERMDIFYKQMFTMEFKIKFSFSGIGGLQGFLSNCFFLICSTQQENVNYKGKNYLITFK